MKKLKVFPLREVQKGMYIAITFIQHSIEILIKSN